MQYMSFAPAGSVHSKASAIFYAQFCLLQIYQMLSEMQVPGGQKTHEPLPFHTYILSSLATKLPAGCAKSPHTRQKKTFAMT